MAEEQSQQERTEQATPKRRQEAQDKGQVARSRELGTVTLLLASAGGALVFGPNISDALQNIMIEGLSIAPGQALDASRITTVLVESIVVALKALAPFFILLLVASVFGSSAVGGWVLSLAPLAFKWDRLDPVKGLGRVFSWKGLVELAKALGKFVLVAAAALLVLWQTSGQYFMLGSEPLRPALAHAATLLGWSFLAVSSTLLIIALIDVPFQLWDFNRKLRMTRQEVRDELKETEGSPDVRRRVRERQRELARRRMMAEVPKADVVITNPDHYSVALKYDQAAMAAPLLVAKGVDHVAQEIRRVARTHRVPIVSAPPLARAIYYSTEINSEIPAGLYLAVAKVLAHVYQLKRAKGSSRSASIKSDDLPIPEEFRRDQGD